MDNDFNKLSDFSVVGLDKYMRPLNAPVTNRGSFVGGMDFNTNFDRNAVTAINLRNFNFNAGTGGTITLGGISNKNGLLTVRDAGGITKVTADNTGITITDGKLTFVNTAGGTVLDGSGLVSTVSFQAASVEDITTRTTTSSTFVDVSGGALSPFVTTRATKTVIYVTGFGYNIAWLQNAVAMQLQAVDSIDGTLVNFPLTIEASLTSVGGGGPPYTSFGYSADYQFASAAVIVGLSAGTHTLKLQYKTNGSGTAELSVTQLGYVVLGV
jgi:hypothetical protein